MSGLFGGGKSTSTVAEKLAGVQIQTSAYGGAVSIVFGTDRVAANLLDYDDFTAIPHTTTQRSGKGGGGSTSNTTYTYTAMIILAICEGPVTLGRVWRDKDVGSVDGFGLTVFTGNRTQAPWSYLTSKHPTKALGYAGTCLVASSAMDLGDSATVKNHSFEVTGFCVVGGGNPDAHPADIIPYFLTDPFVSPGWASAKLGDLTTYRTYCTAAGFWISPTINEQKPAREWLQQMLDATNSEAVWSQGTGGMQLKVIPYGDTPITGNGATYTPNTTPIYDLGPDDFVVSGPSDKPVKVKRTSLNDTYNIIPVEFKDRSLDYNTSLVDDPDPVDLDAFGPRKGETLTLHCIKRQSHALQISRIRAQRSVKCRNTYEFRLGWRYALLEAMDLVTLTEPKIGFNRKVVRIISVEEDERGKLTVTAEEWPFGTASATLYSTQANDGTAPNVNVDPGNANTPVIVDVPALLQSGTDHEIFIGTSGGSNWGGCDVWVSADNSTYSYAGTIKTPARHGVLSANMAAGSGVSDTTTTASVNLTVSKGTLSSVAAQVATDLQSLCAIVDGSATEYFAYQNATLTSAYNYNLGTLLVRGAYGTAQTSHLSGKQFVRVDDALLRCQIPASRLGQTLYIKLVSFNKYGAGKQDISTLTPFTWTPNGQSYPAPYAVTIAASTTRPA